MTNGKEIKHIESFVTKHKSYTGRKLRNLKGIMIHSVGTAQPSAEVFVKRYNDTNREDAVHGIIDGVTGKFYQILPWDKIAPHCGGIALYGYNFLIGIEMCESEIIEYPIEDGKEYKYSDGSVAISRTYWKEQNRVSNRGGTTEEVMRRTYKTAVELFAFLCKLYNLDPLGKYNITGSKQGYVITGHKEGHEDGIASNHSDPDHIWSRFDLDLPRFRRDINQAMDYIEFMIQVKVPAVQKDGEQIQTELRNIGIETLLVLDNGPQLGPFQTKEDADKALLELKKQKYKVNNKTLNYDGFITWEMKQKASNLEEENPNLDSTDSDSSETDGYCDLI